MNLYCFCVIASLNICRQHAFLHGSTKMDLTQQSFCIVYFRNLLFPPLLILQHKRENTFQSNNQNFAACRGQVLFKCAPWSEKNILKAYIKLGRCMGFCIQKVWQILKC